MGSVFFSNCRLISVSFVYFSDALLEDDAPGRRVIQEINDII